MKIIVVSVLLSPALQFGSADPPVFSGPQPGEKIVPFRCIGAFGAEEGKELDFVARAGGKPTLFLFWHEFSRPSAAVVRALGGYAASRKQDGLCVFVVRLHADRTQAAAELKRAQHALPPQVPVGISTDGVEGPGAYGLNRNVGLTVILAKDNVVTANFALVQPSVTDAARIGAAIVDLIGGEAPTQEQFERLAYPASPKREGNERDPKLAGLLRSLIRKDAEPEAVQRAAQAIDEYVAANKQLEKQLGEIAAIAVRQEYGTKAAQEKLKAWAEKFGSKNEPAKRR